MLGKDLHSSWWEKLSKGGVNAVCTFGIAQLIYEIGKIYSVTEGKQLGLSSIAVALVMAKELNLGEHIVTALGKKTESINSRLRDKFSNLVSEDLVTTALTTPNPEKKQVRI